MLGEVCCGLLGVLIEAKLGHAVSVHTIYVRARGCFSGARLMVLRQVGTMTAIGGVIGLGAAIALGRLAQSMLYQMHGYDPTVFAGAAVVLASWWRW